MKPAPFEYVRATSVDDAMARYIEAEDARYLAGGQSLLAALNFRLDAPELLIDISQIGALRGIGRQGNAVIIGAMTRHAEVAADPLVTAHLPLLAQAVAHVAHPAIRHRGTIGGSIALADPASEMPACALALSAVLHVNGPDGLRTISADDFFRGIYETALMPGEILTQIEFPLPATEARHGFAELARRKGDYAMTGLALMTGPSPRIVWFALSDRPVRARTAEAALAAGETRANIAALATDGINVLGDLNASDAVKRHYARILLSRVLQEAGLP
ncbi:MAG: xanthine dehydrogenase family protein subunit M [Pseudomonadota bacterium]